MLNFLADAAPSDFPLTGLGQLGSVGVVLGILFWFGWKQLQRESTRADANEAEIKRLNQLIQDKYVPSLESATKAIADSNDALALAREKRRP